MNIHRKGTVVPFQDICRVRPRKNARNGVSLDHFQLTEKPLRGRSCHTSFGRGCHRGEAVGETNFQKELSGDNGKDRSLAG